MNDLLRGLAITALTYRHNRRQRSLAPIFQALDVTRIMTGRAPQGVPQTSLRCQECRHHLLVHASGPGLGCRRRGCLCLQTPDLIWEAA